MTNVNGKDLAVVDNKTVALIGDDNSLQTVTDRLMALHPAAEEVGKAGMRLVAQLAIMTGANPLPTSGEVWVWKDRDRLVVDLGVAYYRRMARKNDEIFWVEEPRPMTDAERKTNTVPEGALASICKAYCGSKLVRLRDMGAPWLTAEARATRTSTAVVDYEEMFRTRAHQKGWWKEGDPIKPPKGRTWQWVCDKRAEKGFYRTEALIDTTFTDRLEEVQRIVAELGSPERPQIGTPEERRAMTLALHEEYGAPLPDDFYEKRDTADDDFVIDVTAEQVEIEAEVLPPWEGETVFEDEPEPEPVVAKVLEPVTPEERDNHLRRAYRSDSLRTMALAIVDAQVGYDNVPHVVAASVSDNKGFNVSNGIEGPFNFGSTDVQDLVNWLVIRKQVPALSRLM